MSSMSALDTLIAKFEGFGTPAAPSITNGNNPGAIMYGPTAQAAGATGANPNGTAVFPSLDAGINALHTVEANIIGQGNTTPTTFINSYEGVSPNGTQAPGNTPAQTQNYINYVAQGLGISANDTMPVGTPSSPDTVPAATPQGSTLQAILAGMGGAVNGGVPQYGAAATVTNATPSTLGGAGPGLIPDWLSGFSWGRVAAVVIGGALVIAGIFFLRPIQSAVVQTVSTAKKSAALFA